MSLNKEACFITITGPIHQENIKFINICPSRHGGPEYMPQKLTGGRERGNAAAIVGDVRKGPAFNHECGNQAEDQPRNRRPEPRAAHHRGPPDVLRTRHPGAAEHTFPSESPGTLPRENVPHCPRGAAAEAQGGPRGRRRAGGTVLSLRRDADQPWPC